MPINATLIAGWENPTAQYEAYDIIDLVPFTGELPPAGNSPWLHIHAMSCPWSDIEDMKRALIAEHVDNTQEPPVLLHSRLFRLDLFAVGVKKLATAQSDRQFKYEWLELENEKIFSKELGRAMTPADWDTVKNLTNGEIYRVGVYPSE